MHAAAEALKAAAAQILETEVQELWPAAGQITRQIKKVGSALAETTAYKFRGLGWEVAATVSICLLYIWLTLQIFAEVLKVSKAAKMRKEFAVHLHACHFK